MQVHDEDYRYFLTYSGVKLPLTPVNELAADEINNRNTYLRTQFDESGRMVLCQKQVYGETEMEHRYSYHDNGQLKQAVISMAGEQRELCFDEQGKPLR